ncbi:hypothetical protein [Candidatus Allofournierella merdipullorum]|uniref:hypothetical protein n=1 Tax=Candidatus Allofournierella merdipullorum TaxID=2838595 RepID=UPI003AB515EB
MMNNKTELENTALQLKALLTVLSAADGDNVEAMREVPHVMKIAADMAEKVYCTIVEAVEMEVE